MNACPITWSPPDWCSWPFQPKSEVDHFLAVGLRRYTERTGTDPSELRERLIEIRRDGYAWTRGEFDNSINSVAAPLFGADDRLVGALHSHGPSFRFPVEGADEQVAVAVAHAAAKISRSLGWSGRPVGSGLAHDR